MRNHSINGYRETEADFPPEFKILAVLFLNAQKGY